MVTRVSGALSAWAYGMRVAEDLSEHLEDDLGEMDMALATLQAVSDRLAGGWPDSSQKYAERGFGLVHRFSESVHVGLREVARAEP
jgi:hypothetical protein